MAYREALAAQSDLSAYGRNRRLLFALKMKFQVEDIQTVAANGLTDAPDDCKCDLLYVDRGAGIAVLAQAYDAEDEGRASAPANKAADLNTAVSWLLNRPLDELPDPLKSPAQELRSALQDGQIKTLHAWYVHNLPESTNVRDELRTVEHTVQNALQQRYPTSGVEGVVALEVGNETLEAWYSALTTPILVTNELSILTPGAYEMSAIQWKALCIPVPAQWLYQLYRTHGEKLFSANVRGYLGSTRSDANINNGIKASAREEPENFWVFNNGLTAVVHDYSVADGENGWKDVRLSGLSIVNGAQTTGAVGSLATAPTVDAWIQGRFVKCEDQETINKVIQFNNSQNKVEAADFRSNDTVQRRLREEFGRIPEALYRGGRRGGAEDVIRRPPNLLPADTVAQALSAFHGNPGVAYNEKAKIWSSDELYSRIFSERTTAPHMVFCYSLVRAVEAKKEALAARDVAVQTTQAEKQQLAFLRKRGSTFLLASAVARSLEGFADRAIPDKFRVSFGWDVGPEEARAVWVPIVDASIPFSNELLPALENGLKNVDIIQQSLIRFDSLVQATKTANQPIYSAFASNLRSD